MINSLESVSLWIYPPIFSLVVGITLAAIAVLKGKRKSENILLALVCLSWTVPTSTAFICHHLLNDESLLLTIERTMHIFYVYLPSVNILFIHRVNGLKRPIVNIAAFTLSFVLMLLTFTDYYFSGIVKFEWGSIAHGGPAFDVFAVFSGVMIVYGLVVVYLRMRKISHPLRRLKLRYFNISFLSIAILTCMNVPAIKGYNVWPVGNFIFIPLAILTYGILKHRLIAIEVILNVTLPRLFIMSLIFVPNFLLVYFLKPYFSQLDTGLLFLLLCAWYFVNFSYVRRVNPRIRRIFAERKSDITKRRRTDKQKKYHITHLKDLDFDNVRSRLVELMETEKIFCDEDLNLARMAQMVNLSTHQLSEYLNQKLNKSFYAFINEYRINEARHLLEISDRSVLSIAGAVGFNSRSAFNRAFLKQTGATPKEYRKKVAE